MMPETYFASLYEAEKDHWWHASRRDIVLDAIRARYAGLAGLRLLDAGCGTGLMMTQLAELGDVYGVDLSDAALQLCARRGGRAAKASLPDLPFPDRSFDVVTALDVLEHLDDDVAALREFGRLLKPGGRAFLFVPAHRWLWSLQDEVSQHRRRYDRGMLVRAIRESGLEVERATYVNLLLLPVVYAGRQVLKVQRRFRTYEDENRLHPAWSNGILARIFRSEIPMLRRRDLPTGASLMAVAARPAQPGNPLVSGAA